MSTNNPYAPPHSDSTRSIEHSYSGIGVYCDHGTLVLLRSNYKLPGICLKTGEATEGIYPIRVRALPKGKIIAIAIAGGAIGAAIAQAMLGTNFNIDVPLVPGWVNSNAPTKERTKRGWGVVGLGLLLIILGMGLSLVSEGFMILCAVGLIVGIVGLFVGGYKSSKKPYEISTFNAKYIWLDGVDKNIAYQFEPLPAD